MSPARAVLLAALVLSSAVAAQSTAIDIQLFKPAPGQSDVLNVQGSRVAQPFDWQAGLYVHYANHPLSVVNPNTRTSLTRLVSSQTTFDLIGSMGLIPKLELGVHIPLAINGSEPAPFIGEEFTTVGGLGLGDIRLIPKYFLLQRDALGVAVSVPLVIPSGRSSAFLGSGGVGAQPRIVADWTMPNDFRFLGNLGFNLRPAHELLNLRVGNELAYSVGAEVPIKIQGRDLAVMSTLNGAVGLPNDGLEEAPLELLVAGRYRFLPNLAATVGFGRGLTPGYGTPDLRVLAGVMWTERYVTPKPAPIDEQKKPAPEKPVCRTGPEDVDGFRDDDACGDPDNDADGVDDGADTCPDDAETKNGYRDTDGCPDDKPEQLSPLPRVPADTDSDADGIVDIEDRCATAAEDKDGFEDTDGCPEADNDRDGIADGSDKCALEAETINGVTDDDGCPDKGKSKVIVKGEKIVILEKVYFATGKDQILEKSFNVLNQVSSVLKANPHIKLVHVEGHTDSQGDDASNMDLSQRRANSVVAYVIKAGVDAARLRGIGYGETKPVDDNKTAKGRENNRRVEFTIVSDEPTEKQLDATPVETTPPVKQPEQHDGGTP